MGVWESDRIVIGRIQSRLYEPPQDDFTCERCRVWAGEDNTFTTPEDDMLCWDCFWAAFDEADAETREAWVALNGLKREECRLDVRDRLYRGRRCAV